MFNIIFFPQAVGEPPLFVASAAFFAIKNAIQTAREENGIEGYFRLDAPATAEKIRLACEDSITLRVKEINKYFVFVHFSLVISD